MKKLKINHYVTHSDKKCAIIERFNRSLKQLMYRKFTEVGTYEWVNQLPNFLVEYNDRYHRTIGMKPSQVNDKNSKIVLANIRKNRQKYVALDKKSRFKIGDKVRISKYKRIFDKGYLPNWTNEIFVVSSIKNTLPVTYTLNDYKGEPIEGSFYTFELQKTKFDNVYLVEKIIKKKGDRLLVKWLGFSGEHSSWVNKNDII